MRQVILTFLLGSLAVMSCAQNDRQGYVLKVGDGEIAAGAIIKASPKSGTQSYGRRLMCYSLLIIPTAWALPVYHKSDFRK